ncbi:MULTISPECIES: ROK family protein [Clostridium]|uniref:fructokinase n=1 Tax=Clostridium acetobutylicum (strain ATCC 824 / DSM 792 / JCM 1419 / IAM 19013 / LMG 5710 / NBRC 13948 / NRRL B-527 / VKM B-1787 / 2291 / W) TaxID=272562 RepID=Q97IW7_CLOAB|nr:MULTISPECIES: ROK family protein [Clostridium]AAK79490.1 Fructokinase [Clostridium acetobutylicum ATCC 824]AEI31853.1 fructokinase [Clostridium acetobutylicum DSM 1731]AWV81265.1 ROK family protein [Clostridium acetobutylicum]MBC2392899.1 ROK family protein [Clostridium acetobutylicum]MBC2583042.1 ROK family protein [Clostridium acetobutylicum]
MMYGAIEAGGTKFVCAVSDENLNIIERESIKTTIPEETMTLVFKFFDKFKLEAIGIGSFGPIDVNKKSKTYGYITNTPKQGWANYDFVGAVKNRYNIPIGWTTDVNAAALGELKKGAAVNLESCVYLTVGTGIGGGAVVKGKLLEGYGHPEMGHILVRRHEKDTYEGKCPFHKDCLEGMAAGPAIEARWGKKAYDLTDKNEVWEMEAYYIAQGLMTYTLTLSPERIVLGGGVMKQLQLFPLIRKHLEKLMANYVAMPNLEEYIVPPALKDNAGITGCLLLAMDSKKLV